MGRYTRYVSLWLLCTTLILVSINPAGGATTTEPTVMITNYTIDPAIFIPGDRGTLTVTITNREASSSRTLTTTSTTPTTTTSTTSTSDIKTRIEDVRLYTYSRGIGSVREDMKRVVYDKPGALAPGESITLTFPLEVDVEDGRYLLEVRIAIEDGINVRYPILITVDSSAVEPILIDIPDEISLKGSQVIQLAVANTRANRVKGVRITPHAENFEFTPESIFIGEMKSNEKRRVNFTLTPLRPGSSTITFNVEYRNGDNLHTVSLTREVDVVDRDDLRVILVSCPEVIPRGGSGKIELDVANGRSNDLSSVRVIPIHDEAFRIYPSEVFIGDMEQDDIFTAEFEIHPITAASGLENISFKAVFRDMGNDKLYETNPLVARIRIEENGEDTPGFSIISILVALFIAGFIIFRKR
ncbi:MAG TPA: hypothetical protein ENG09_03665 [Candidatus Syntrophoarchaeum butanivorans]|uniref:S-layer protein n=1 Tax=Candidatus Syntropharchaeum butanivorans TaxID=1839936 RepID=A0A7C0X2W7_9EURY|nr:hypothetical protein [Candidatus Syntrophoarchaeum butanivorans]